MNIVFLSHEYPLWASGGIGTFLQTFGRVLVVHGHRVTVLGPGGSDKEEILEDQGVKLIRLRKNNGRFLNFLHNARQINRKLEQLQQQAPIDIIEASELGLAFVSRKHPAKKVIRLHGGHHFFAESEQRGIDRKKGWMEKRSFRKADGFIAVSQYVKDHTAKYLSFGRRPLEVINYPIDTSQEPLDLEQDPNSILFAGTICDKKGVRELVQAMALLRLDFPDLRLDCYGRDWYYPDGRSYIAQLRQDLPTDHFDRVIFHGAVPREELNKKYAVARICVFPSRMETQGLVSLEAMLLGKPVVFSQYGPGPETITHGENGLLCDVYDPADIARKIRWYLENTKEAQEMGIRARKQVLVRYEKEFILSRNIKFYNDLLHGE
jgi:glycosyltransferase involved in cell wall biosynthesis